MTNDELFTAFANIEEILDLHVAFEAKLASRIENWNETSRISDIFLNEVSSTTKLTIKSSVGNSPSHCCRLTSLDDTIRLLRITMPPY